MHVCLKSDQGLKIKEEMVYVLGERMEGSGLSDRYLRDGQRTLDKREREDYQILEIVLIRLQ